MTCRHPERGRIDFLLATGGASLMALGVKFGLSKDSLHRHKRDHISAEYTAAVRLGPLQDLEELRALCAKHGTGIIDAMQAINAGVTSRWLVALESGSDDMLVSLTGQIRKNLELMAKLTQELMPQSTSTTTIVNNSISLYEAPQYVETIAAVSLALRPYPEARKAVVAALRQHKAGTTVAMIEAQANPEAI
jgi:hypothetical protein